MENKADNKVDNKVEEAYLYLKKIRKVLQEDNRFFPDDMFTKYMDYIFREKEVIIPVGTNLYRARYIENEEIDKSKRGTSFEGYDAEGSFVNKDNGWPTYGRMNPQGISVLYVSTDERTAITELHPYVNAKYSVATIMVKENLRVVDLSKSDSGIIDDFVRPLSVLLQEKISEGSTNRHYILPQYVSSYCKYKEYDGICYRSKYATQTDCRSGKGINYTIFNYEKCVPTGSKIKLVDRVSVQIDDYPRSELQKH